MIEWMQNLVCVTIIEDWGSCHLFFVMCRSVGDIEWKNRKNGGTHCIEFGVFFFFLMSIEFGVGTYFCRCCQLFYGTRR